MLYQGFTQILDRIEFLNERKDCLMKRKASRMHVMEEKKDKEISQYTVSV